MNTLSDVMDSWTFCRSMDGSKVQLDYMLASSHIDVTCAWNDNTLTIGLDHRCVHCHLDIPLSKTVAETSEKRLFKTLATISRW